MSSPILRCLLIMKQEDQQPPPDIPAEGEKTIMVIGDKSCGKTCLIAAFVTNCAVDVTKAVTKHIRRTISFGRESVPVVLREGLSEPQNDSERHENYRMASAVLVCFALDDQSDRSVPKWVAEARLCRPNADLFVVGCKLDLSAKPAVSVDVWKSLLESIHPPVRYLECSAKTGERISRLVSVVGGVLMDADNGS